MFRRAPTNEYLGRFHEPGLYRRFRGVAERSRPVPAGFCSHSFSLVVTMKLLFTPNPEYIHKVLVVAHEAGVIDRLEFERQVPFDPDTSVQETNPLGKVPAFLTDEGEPLYGGLVICEYLDSFAPQERSLFPPPPHRWQALRQMVLGDGMFDATTNMRVESWRGEETWHEDYLARERAKIVRCLNAMEADAKAFNSDAFHIGHVCFAGGISYLDLRNPIREVGLESGDDDFDWRSGRPALSDWYDSIQSRPSIAYRIHSV